MRWWLLCLLVVCGGCESRKPPSVEHMQQLDHALHPERGGYERAVARLFEDPAEARKVLKLRAPPAGTRERFLLELLANRLENAARYKEWNEQSKRSAGIVRGMDRSRYGYFWAEKLLLDGGAVAATAASHLAAIDNETSREALGFRLADTRREPDEGSRIAAEALAAKSETQPIVSALAAWLAADVTESVRESAVGQLHAAAGKLPARERRAVEGRLLRELENETLATAERRARLVVLREWASEQSLTRLAKLRRTPWGSALRADVDAALMTAASRREAHPLAAATEKSQRR